MEARSCTWFSCCTLEVNFTWFQFLVHIINLLYFSWQLHRANYLGEFGYNIWRNGIPPGLWHRSGSPNFHLFDHLLEPLWSFDLRRFVLPLWNQQFVPRPQELPHIFCTVDLGLLLGCRDGYCCYDLLHQRLGLYCGMKSFVWCRDFQLTISGESKPKRVSSMRNHSEC